MRLTVAVTVACFSILGLALGEDAHASIRKLTNIPAQPLGVALQSFAKDRHLQMVYVSEDVNRLNTEGAVGELDTDEVLQRILKGTGLTYRYLNQRTVTIEPTRSTNAVPHATSDESTITQSSREETRNKAFWDRFRLAAMDQGGGTSVASTVGSPNDSSYQNARNPGVKLEEVVVTAQKREERLRDVPVPVTSIVASDLATANQFRIQDYFSKVPSLGFAPLSDRGLGSISLRGIVSGGTNPTVGIMIDEVPYGSTTKQGSGYTPPDIDPSDLARIEVLRGPQGTLYGANSMGGLLKFVTVEPSISEFSGRVEAGTVAVQGGHAPGYNLRAAVNVPISDTLALRASGFTGRDPGYIYDVLTGQHDVNSTDRRGGRLSALWKPAAAFSLKLSALIQTSERNGRDEVNLLPGLGDLQQVDVIGSGGYNQRTQMYSATMTGELGKSTLTSVSGYSIHKLYSDWDFSYALRGYEAVWGSAYGAQWGSSPGYSQTKRFSEELRLAMPLSAYVDWLSGVFYNHEGTVDSVFDVARDPVTGAVGQTFLSLYTPSTFEERALFTDFTFKITPKFDVQLGGRYSTNRTDLSNERSGPLAPKFFGALLSLPEVRDKDHSMTYLVTPRLRVSPDVMVYARIASGYQPGGPNQSCAPTIQCAYGASTTQNYEIGLKGDVLNHAVMIDTSVYHIKWNRFLTVLYDKTSNLFYYADAGSATSQGVELSLESHPLAGMKLSAWYAYDDAELATTTPGAPFATKGSELPTVSRHSGDLSLQQDFTVTADATMFVGADLRYIGQHLGNFGTLNAIRQEYGGYAQLDLQAGMNFRAWTLSLFANNVTDKRAALTAPLDKNNVKADPYNLIRPRAVGISVARTL